MTKSHVLHLEAQAQKTSIESFSPEIMATACSAQESSPQLGDHPEQGTEGKCANKDKSDTLCFGSPVAFCETCVKYLCSRCVKAHFLFGEDLKKHNFVGVHYNEQSKINGAKDVDDLVKSIKKTVENVGKVAKKEMKKLSQQNTNDSGATYATNATKNQASCLLQETNHLLKQWESRLVIDIPPL